MGGENFCWGGKFCRGGGGGGGGIFPSSLYGTLLMDSIVIIIILALAVVWRSADKAKQEQVVLRAAATVHDFGFTQRSGDLS